MWTLLPISSRLIIRVKLIAMFNRLDSSVLCQARAFAFQNDIKVCVIEYNFVIRMSHLYFISEVTTLYGSKFQDLFLHYLTNRVIIVYDYLVEIKFSIVNWPVRSPDLSPIEHIFRLCYLMNITMNWKSFRTIWIKNTCTDSLGKSKKVNGSSFKGFYCGFYFFTLYNKLGHDNEITLCFLLSDIRYQHRSSH